MSAELPERIVAKIEVSPGTITTLDLSVFPVNAIEAAARTLNDEGWTCTAHEPEPFGQCPDCAKALPAAVEAVVRAFLLSLTEEP